MKNKQVLLSAIAGVLAIGGAGATAWAATNASGNSSYPPIVQRIADKFKLNPSDVQKVFDEQKTQRQADRRQKISDYLDTKVKDGTITQDQKNKILAKLDELHQQLKDNQQDRHQLHDQLQQWAKDNGINLQDLLPRHMGGFRPHQG